MTGLEVLLAAAGLLMTGLVGMGMVLLTPRGAVDVHTEGDDPRGSNLSPTETTDRPMPAPVIP